MAEREEADLTLLIVEDDDRTRGELERILSKRTDLRVAVAARPDQALALPTPDLALLDIRLPGMSGLELLDRLRQRNADLMAIVMTGFGEASTAREARERGAVDFLEKPLDLAYLLVVLRQQAREVRLRRSLRHAGALFQGVVEHIPDGIVMASASGEVLYGNTLGKTLHDLGPSEHGTSVVHGGRTYRAERTVSGDRVLWRWADLTLALEEERLRSYRVLARLMAHELHNPLTPMRLWLQELQAVGPEDPDAGRLLAEAVPVLLEQVERLGKLSGRFRDLAEDRPLAKSPVGAADVAASAMRALRPQAERAGVAVRSEVPGDLSLQTDEGALYQLLFNLLRNAVEAQEGRPGEVVLRGGTGAQTSFLEVEDRGGGLPPEVAAAPFTPYLTTKAQGTGLGLVVCRELAARMGGALELLDRPGTGLTARLHLPSVPAPGTGPPVTAITGMPGAS